MSVTADNNCERTLLLVEDSPIDARLIECELADVPDVNFRLEHVTDLASAFERLERGGVDVALVDLFLPDEEGVETFRRIHGVAPTVPIVVLTSFDDEQAALQTIQLGAQDYLIKGEVDSKLLVRSLRYAMQRHRAGILESLNQHLEATKRSLDEAVADLKRKNDELDQFTYFASHDLQEPLRKVISFSELLVQDLGGDLNEQAQKDLWYVTDAASRMQGLVQALLTLSRAGKSATQNETVLLHQCADRALDALLTRIEESNTTITRDVLPTVIGDPTLLTQVYQNLIGNALKFTGPRQPTVHLTARPDGDQWILGVKDNGIGMEPKYAQQIFAPFQRLHGRDEYEGTGIGLAICRKAVERHGGRIWVESQPGEGAHFMFTMPQASDLGVQQVPQGRLENLSHFTNPTGQRGMKAERKVSLAGASGL